MDSLVFADLKSRAICQGWAREEWQEIFGIIGSPWLRLGEQSIRRMCQHRKSPASSQPSPPSLAPTYVVNEISQHHCIVFEMRNIPVQSFNTLPRLGLIVNCPERMMQMMQDGECECVLWRQMCQLNFAKFFTIFWEGLLLCRKRLLAFSLLFQDTMQKKVPSSNIVKSTAKFRWQPYWPSCCWGTPCPWPPASWSRGCPWWWPADYNDDDDSYDDKDDNDDGDLVVLLLLAPLAPALVEVGPEGAVLGKLHDEENGTWTCGHQLTQDKNTHYTGSFGVSFTQATATADIAQKGYK